MIHASPTLGLMVQGLLYVTTSEFMPYHSDAVGAAWGDLPPNYQGFFLGVLRGMGAGSIGVTLAIAFILLIPFRRGDRWALWAVPAIGVVFTALTAYAAFTIDVRTPASPPWRQTLGLTAMYVAGGLTTLWPERARVSAPGMLFFSAAAADSAGTGAT